ncbi:MAG: o-succinylbenzoate--CoA ligase [Nakamurella sp.]
MTVPTGDAVLDLLPRLAAALDGSGPALRPVPPGAVELPVPDQVPDLALVVPTSGSTGMPKQVLLTAAALHHSAEAGQNRLHDGDPGHWLLTLPVHHIAGLNVLLRAVLAGREPVVMDTSAPFTPAAFAAAAARLPGGPTFVSLVPTQLHRLLTDPAGTEALQRFTAVLVGGAATAGSQLAAARAAGVAVVTSYGMSETSGGCVYDGHPLDGVRAALDAAGRIVLTGPVVAAGYAGQPFAGSRFTTSDLGAWSDGRLVVLGRADDVLITGGVNVSPQAVEDALLGAPGLDQVVLTGVPDPEWGTRLVAVVVAGGDGPPVLADLRDRATAAVGPASAPKEMVVLDAIPTLSPGKVDRAAVASLARAALAR